jgi:hypothetical protein
MFSVSVWGDVWGPEVSSLSVTGSRLTDDGSVGDFLVWELSHELRDHDRLTFYFDEGSVSSPPDDSPIEEPNEAERPIDFFGPIPEEEIKRLESRPTTNLGCR